eukprot:1352253-Amorphochlora_amoeboformis.AAC.1
MGARGRAGTTFCMIFLGTVVILLGGRSSLGLGSFTSVQKAPGISGKASNSYSGCVSNPRNHIRELFQVFIHAAEFWIVRNHRFVFLEGSRCLTESEFGV